MAELVLAAMALAAALYVVFAGADFGVGVLEPLLPPQERARVEAAIAPVWEVNHVWLVLIAVLAFVGFPSLYTTVSTYLHVPLLLVLLGIVARGAAFTFRHYDPGPAQARRAYTLVFRLSSLATPMFLGVIVATMASGTLGASPSPTFVDAFVTPWLSPLAWATGAFVTALFTFQGAALLSAEVGAHGHTLPWLRLARRLHATTIGLGAAVLLLAARAEAPWLRPLLTRAVPLTCLLAATALIPAVAWAFHRGRPWLLRLASAAQSTLVLLAFGAAQYPVLVRLAPRDVTVASAAATPATLRWLLVALAIGLALIVPALVYLLRVYKRRPAAAPPPDDARAQ